MTTYQRYANAATKYLLQDAHDFHLPKPMGVALNNQRQQGGTIP